MNKIKQLLKAHKFFVKESRFFVGKLSNRLFNDEVKTGNIKRDTALSKFYKIPFEKKLYYPIAYIKFMKCVLKDNNLLIKENKNNG